MTDEDEARADDARPAAAPVSHATTNGATRPADLAPPSQPTANGTAPPPPPEKVGTFYALRYRNYRLAWTGDLFHSFAMWVQQTTMGWLVFDITNSGSILGLMHGIRVVPTLLLSPVAGATIDRMSRRRIIAITQLLQFVFTFILALDVLAGTVVVWHLLVFTLLITSSQVFNQPARQTLVFDLVPRHAIANAVGLGHMAFSVARSVGPAIGGALIVWLGAGTNFLLQAFGYLIVMVAILMIRMPPSTRPARAKSASMMREIGEGFRFVANDPQARILMLMSIIYPMFIIPMHMALMPIFAKRIFDADAGGLGILLASIGVGGMIGGLASATMNQFDRRGLLQLFSLFLCAGPLILFGIAGELTGSLLVGAALLLVSGIGGSMFTTTNQTVIQLMAPDHMRGRLTSIMQISHLLSSVGTLLAGVMADVVGAVVVGTTLGLGATAVGLGIFIFSPRIRYLRLSELERRPEPHSGPEAATVRGGA